MLGSRIVLVLVCSSGPLAAQVGVLTQHNDLARTGANLNETTLTTSNVNSNQFGLLFTRPVDGQIYAQPLIVPSVNLGANGTHNLVIVATVNDSVYAFDADNKSVAAPYWQVSFLGAGIEAPRSADVGGCATFSGNLGLVGTPVIDPVSGTLYVVARTKEPGPTFVQRLHALDVSTGAERPNSPVVIAGSYPGNNSVDSVAGQITFNPLQQNQRAGLALVNGVVYICWTSQCDQLPYHGWIMGYEADSLQQVAVYNDTPDNSEGGVWMSGQAPAADSAGNLYVSLGNGPTGNSINPQTEGARVESFLKLTPVGSSLSVASSFTPYNWQDLDNGDNDLGSAGLLLIPGTSLAFSGGKQGVMYLVNRDQMGGLTSGNSDDNVVQSFPVSSSEVHGGPVWWNSPDGSYAYVWPAQDYLQQYQFNPTQGMFALPAYAKGPTGLASGQPGGFLSLSANGSAAGSGILWAVHQVGGDAEIYTLPGVLHAYDAQNVSRELWNSQQVAARDAVGNFAKDVPPTVANGKVYLATFSNRLNVYGLLGAQSGQSAASNWVQELNFSLAAWPDAQARAVLISTRTIVNSLNGVLPTPVTGQPIRFSLKAQLIRKQNVADGSDAGVRYFIRDGSPPVDTDVSGYLVHTTLVSRATASASGVAEHRLENFSLVNVPTLSFQVSGVAAPVLENFVRTGTPLPSAFSMSVAGWGSSADAGSVVLQGILTLGAGKLEKP
ncbi:exported hypothetical protein [Verrucomicrobia bacterium]|nr:exported hypothetical protein [Verrucomicrobiota bacterium]